MSEKAYRVIDLESYPRRDHFAYFRTMANPYVGVTVEVDITELLAFTKEKKISFYLTFLHAASLAADGVPEFRRRIKDGKLIEYISCGTSHTESRPDGTYGYCTLFHDRPLKEYIPYAEREREAARTETGLFEDEEVDRLYFISTLPWLSYTNLIQPTAGGDESNPRITWGKAKEDFRGRRMMPVTVLCHHALVDGIHLAMFYENLEKEMKAILSSEI